MIIGKGRVLVVPRPEVRIGTSYDNQSETRQIRIHRYAPGGIDLAHLSFRLDLRYANEWVDSCMLEKEVQEEHVLLTWLIPASCVSHPGTVWIAVRASSEDGAVKWATVPCPLYVDLTVGPPEHENVLTELEQMEKLVEDTLSKAESVIQEYEKYKEQAEEAIRQAEEALEKAKTKAEEAEDFAEDAEAWAHGREDHPEQAEDNSKYWSGQSKGSAEEAEKQADRAMAYANFITPEFELENNRVYLKRGVDSNVEFKIDDNKMYLKLPA